MCVALGAAAVRRGAARRACRLGRGNHNNNNNHHHHQ